jgi:hypothetical protein
MYDKLDLYTGPSGKDFLKDKLSPITRKSSKKPYYNPTTDDVVVALKNPNMSEDSKKLLFTAYKEGRLSAEEVINIAKKTAGVSEAMGPDAIDTIVMDVPLFLRILEYSREDAQEDVDLHYVTQQAVKLTKEKGALQMSDYNTIIGKTNKKQDLGEMVRKVLKDKTSKNKK